MKNPDQVSLRIGELTEGDVLDDFRGTHKLLPAEALGLLEGPLEPTDGDIVPLPPPWSDVDNGSQAISTRCRLPE